MATAYFAYGSNLNRTEMVERCPGATVMGVAVLPRHRFLITRAGFATVVNNDWSLVHGVLWMITDSDERVLDRYEGLAEGLYHKRRRWVELVAPPQRTAVDSLLYVATDAEPGRPRAGYLEQVIAAAEDQGLPEEYIAELTTWRTP
jgi:hypothetical protein